MLDPTCDEGAEAVRSAARVVFDPLLMGARETPPVCVSVLPCRTGGGLTFVYRQIVPFSAWSRGWCDALGTGEEAFPPRYLALLGDAAAGGADGIVVSSVMKTVLGTTCVALLPSLFSDAASP